MGLNITDATCDFGLAQTADGCVRTLASYDQDAYLTFQIIYCVVGALSVVASAVMFWRAVKYDGSPLQQYSFLLCSYASLTVIIRGIDPTSYGHVIPRPINAFLTDSCTAALYSVYILALGYWATVIQQGAAMTDKPMHLKCLENSAIAFVWAFYTAYNMSLFAFKGFQPTALNYVQLGLSICVLAIMSTGFMIYGLRVLSRLQEYERIQKLRIPSTASDVMSTHSYDMDMSDEEDYAPVAEEPRSIRHRPKQGHTTKIKKILFVAETVSLIVIAAQLYVTTNVSSTPVELSCANGRLCDTVKTSWSLLHTLQVPRKRGGERGMLGLNITDATCEFGLAQTASGCVRTLSSYDLDVYFQYQIIYCAVGAVTEVACAIMYWRAVKYDGSPLQQYCFLFCSYAALTVIFRGVDPTGYGHVIPRPITAFLTDSCTAALYSVYILALGYWALIIQQGAALMDGPTHLKCLEGSAIAFVWAFYIAYNMSLFAFKGFQPAILNYIQLSVSAGVLAVVSIAFLVYGLRVLSRLQAYEQEAKLRMSSMICERMAPNESFNLVLSDDEDGVPVVSAPRYARRKPKEGHSAKIKKILLVAGSISLIVIAGQLFMAITKVSNTPVELSCANGTLCDTVKTSWSLLHTLQVTAHSRYLASIEVVQIDSSVR
ncbi:hypothetical protein BBJ28_00015717, partial [Nothophytophthora sp. Chile5]